MKWHCEHSNIRFNSQEYSSRVHIYRVISKLLTVIKETKHNLRGLYTLWILKNPNLFWFLCLLIAKSSIKCFDVSRKMFSLPQGSQKHWPSHTEPRGSSHGKDEKWTSRALHPGKAESVAGKWREFNHPKLNHCRYSAFCFWIHRPK